MRRRGFTPIKLLFLAPLATGLMAGLWTEDPNATTRSSCVSCHTDESALIRNLKPVVATRSLLTSGAG